MLVRGRYEEVIPACSAAVEHGEGLEPEALLLRATMYLLQGQHSLALEDLNTIINSQVQNTKDCHCGSTECFFSSATRFNRRGERTPP
ncbi:hypothetical protein J6590_075677 [Homalodisca vitripennis]|nr:hypothetical protein J6590_075677 [Homalodisca vitripennis]